MPGKRGRGVKTPDGAGVWLDTPMIEKKGGEGTILARISFPDPEEGE